MILLKMGICFKLMNSDGKMKLRSWFEILPFEFITRTVYRKKTISDYNTSGGNFFKSKTSSKEEENSGKVPNKLGARIQELEDNEWISDCAFLTDMCEHFNTLNYRLQGHNQNIVHMYDMVKSFVTMIDVWRIQIENGEFHHFECLKSLSNISPQKVKNYCDIMEKLITEFKDKRLVDFKNMENDFALYANPFTVSILKVKPILQLEVADLQNDTFLKSNVSRRFSVDASESTKNKSKCVVVVVVQHRGREDVHQKRGAGRQQSARDDVHVNAVRALLEEHHCWTCIELAREVGVAPGTILHILKKKLKLRKICARWDKLLQTISWYLLNLDIRSLRDNLLCIYKMGTVVLKKKGFVRFSFSEEVLQGIQESVKRKQGAEYIKRVTTMLQFWKKCTRPQPTMKLEFTENITTVSGMLLSRLSVLFCNFFFLLRLPSKLSILQPVGFVGFLGCTQRGWDVASKEPRLRLLDSSFPNDLHKWFPLEASIFQTQPSVISRRLSSEIK
ncbi:hypothetical protein C0J52_23692 [Blattella germanica]|nr:hypothetical protein C0J52_23692 [Blattella germanica]